MNLAGLPGNVQRRIALLLHQDTHEQTPPSAPFTLPDPPTLDQAVAATRYKTRAAAKHHDNIQVWNFPVHALAAQLRQQPAVVVNGAALGPSKLQACRSEAEHVLHYAKAAGLGGGLQPWENLKARGDQNVWLKRHQQVEAGHTALVALMDAMMQLQQCLAGSFDVMGPASFQLARYPGNGSRYVRHADASPSSPARSITAIYYLNPDWDDDINGGKLCLYHKRGEKDRETCGEQVTLVAPAGDSLVVFDSHMEHEVMPTFADRYALTVWFSREKKSNNPGHRAKHGEAVMASSLHASADELQQAAEHPSLQHIPSPTNTNKSALTATVESQHNHNIQPTSSSAAESSNSSPTATATTSATAMANAPSGSADASTPLNENIHASSTASLAQDSGDTATIPVPTVKCTPAMSQELGGSNAGALAQTAEHQPAMEAQAGRDSTVAQKVEHQPVLEAPAGGDSTAAVLTPAAEPSPDVKPGSACRAAGCSTTAQPVHDKADAGGNTAAASTPAVGAQQGTAQPVHDKADGGGNTAAASTPAVGAQQGTAQPVHDTAKVGDDTGAASTPAVAAEQGRDHGSAVGQGNEGSKPGSIFVSIAAYRDPECQWTVHDLFRQAEEADLVTVGVVWQINAVADAAFVRVAGNTQRHRQVREIRIPWQEATGPCKARHLAQQLWNGEEYYLQIDSHMRFVTGWDTTLKQMLQQAELLSSHGKAVVSSYPPAYEGEGPSASLPPTLDPTRMRVHPQGWDQDGMLRLIASCVPASQSRGVVPAQFWAAGFSFSRAQLITQVPYSPHLPFLFFGEEMMMLARMWTHGWDVFAPTQAVAFHLWSRAYRHTFQADIPVDTKAKAKSQAYVKQLLRHSSKLHPYDDMSQEEDDSCCLQTGHIALGSVRSLRDFWQHCSL